MLYLNGPVVVGEGDVDGEVCVDGAHLVAIALGDALDHVLDVRADRADGSDLLAHTEPLAHAQTALSDAFHRKLIILNEI